MNALRLSFGKLSGIEPLALATAFQIQARESKAQGARLEFEVLPIALRCLDCRRDTVVESFPLPCSLCGGMNVLLAGGTEELRLLEMDVD